MGKAVNDILEQIKLYYSDSIFLFLAIISYAYCMVKNRKLREKLLYPIGLILLCILNPILYKWVFSYTIYWRLFWLMPNAIVITLAIMKIIQECNGRIRKVLLLTIFIVGIIIVGNNAYIQADYKRTENLYKVPRDVMVICDIVLATGESPKCIMPNNLFSDARQYSGDIQMLYGRDVNGFIIDTNYKYSLIANEMEKEFPDYEYVFYNATTYNCDCVVTYASRPVPNELLNEYGYGLIGITDTYYVYSVIEEKENIGWQITQYGREISSRGLMSCYTIEDENGNLIIIDGGFAWSNLELRNIINAYDNHVTAWIITDMTKGHIGAFNDIMTSVEDIRVDTIYTCDIDIEDTISDVAGDVAQNYKDFLDIVEKNQNIVYLKKGDIIELCGLKMNVLEDISSENSALCFELRGEKECMLFCSNIDENVENDIINYYNGDFDVDYLQAAYHGCRWRTPELYKYLNPNIVFFDSQSIFLDDDYATRDVWEYFEAKGSKVFNFSTAPNRIVLK